MEAVCELGPGFGAWLGGVGRGFKGSARQAQGMGRVVLLPCAWTLEASPCWGWYPLPSDEGLGRCRAGRVRESVSLTESPSVPGCELHLGLTLLPSCPAPTSGNCRQEVLLIRALITG